MPASNVKGIVTVVGIKELQRKMDTLELNPPVDRGVWVQRWKDIASPYVQEAKNNVPIVEGYTQRSIRARATKVSSKIYIGGRTKNLLGVRRNYFGDDRSISPEKQSGWWLLHRIITRASQKIFIEIDTILEEMIRKAGLGK